MAIDIKLNTDADLGGVDRLADGLEQVADAAQDLDKHDAGKLEKSLDKAADAADDTADALKDAGKAGDKLDDAADAAKDLEKGLDRAEKAADDLGDAGKDLDKIEDAADDAAQEIDRDLVAALKRAAEQADATGKASQEGFAKGFSAAGEAQEEVLDEMTSNWGETMSSWNGSAQDAVRIIADTFGGLAGSMAIGGAAGSLIFGAVAGVISLIVQKWEDGSGQIEERNKAMYDQMIDNANAYFNNEQIVENFHKLMNSDEDALIDQATMDMLVKQSGLSRQDVALGIADPRGQQGQGLSNALDTQYQDWAGREPAKPVSDGTYKGNTMDQAESSRAAWEMEGSSINRARDALDSYRTGVEDTSDAVQSNTDYLAENGLLLDENGERSRDLVTAQADSAQALTDTTAAIKDNNESYEDAADARVANQAALADLVGTLAEEQDALKASGASAAEVTALQADQAQSFIDTAAAAGIEQDAALDLAAQLGLIPEDVATDIKEHGADWVKKQAQTTGAEVDKLDGKTATARLQAVGPSPMAIAGLMATMQAQVNARPVQARMLGVLGRVNF